MRLVSSSGMVKSVGAVATSPMQPMTTATTKSAMRMRGRLQFEPTSEARRCNAWSSSRQRLQRPKARLESPLESLARQKGLAL